MKNISLSKDQKMSLQEDQLKELQEEQIQEANGTKPTEMVEANLNSKYQVKKRDSEEFVHVWTREKHAGADGKSSVNHDKVIKIRYRQFNNTVASGAFATYDEIEVIHDPRSPRPEAYNLKPTQVNVGGPATTPNLTNVSREQLEVREQAVAKQEKKLARQNDELAKRLEAIEKRQEKQDNETEQYHIQMREKDNELQDLRAQLAEANAANEDAQAAIRARDAILDAANGTTGETITTPPPSGVEDTK